MNGADPSLAQSSKYKNTLSRRGAADFCHYVIDETWSLGKSIFENGLPPIFGIWVGPIVVIEALYSRAGGAARTNLCFTAQAEGVVFEIRGILEWLGARSHICPSPLQ